jgi:hypothetical protein
MDLSCLSPSYKGSINRWTVIQASSGKKSRSYLKNNYSKKGLGCGSSGRAPASQTQGPEFKHKTLWGKLQN